MDHQYPGAISPDENMLAELMLPDQTHIRTQDWTMFFLHKDSGANEDEEEEAAKNIRREDRKEKREKAAQANADGEDQISDTSSEDSEDSEDEDPGEGPPLMYVLNLVNTKQDNTVKR